MEERCRTLSAEAEARNAALMEKEELIEALRSGEARDVAAFKYACVRLGAHVVQAEGGVGGTHACKERHAAALRELRARCDSLVGELAAREGEVRDGALERSQLSRELTLLTLRSQQQEEMESPPPPPDSPGSGPVLVPASPPGGERERWHEEEVAALLRDQGCEHGEAIQNTFQMLVVEPIQD